MRRTRDEYIRRVRDTAIRASSCPARFTEGYHELQSHCFAYIHATEVGGTHPALIEAMGRGALVLYLEHAGERRRWRGARGFRSKPDTLTREVASRCWRCREAERDAMASSAQGAGSGAVQLGRGDRRI